MTRTLRLGLALAAVALIAAIPVGGASADGPTAQASRNCDPRTTNAGQSYPPASYVTTIRTRNVSCRKAKKVIRAFHRCRGERPKGGPGGRCTHRVLRFRCREGDRRGVPGVQYNGSVTCRRGGKRITSRYVQNV